MGGDSLTHLALGIGVDHVLGRCRIAIERRSEGLPVLCAQNPEHGGDLVGWVMPNPAHRKAAIGGQAEQRRIGDDRAKGGIADGDVALPAPAHGDCFFADNHVIVAEVGDVEEIAARRMQAGSTPSDGLVAGERHQGNAGNHQPDRVKARGAETRDQPEIGQHNAEVRVACDHGGPAGAFLRADR